MSLHVHKLNTETSDTPLVKKDMPTLVSFDVDQFLAECDNATLVQVVSSQDGYDMICRMCTMIYGTD